MADTQGATVRFPRLESRGLLLGLSAPQLVAVGAGLLVAVCGQYAAGTAGLVVTAPLWAVLTAGALVPVAGRTAMAWLPVGAGWVQRRATGGTRHRAAITGPARGLEIPGVPGLRLLTAPTSHAALVHDPRAGTLTAVLEVHGRGFLLDDAVTQEQRLAGWGRLLASLCQAPGVVRAQLIARTRPGGAEELRRWWAERAVPQDAWAARVVADLVAESTAAGHRHETLLAVSWRAPRSARAAATSLAAVEQQLGSLRDAVTAADLDVAGWLDDAGLAAVLRGGFDPCSPGGRDGVDVPGDPLPVTAVDEQWDRLRTDSAWHAVFWLREWPRAQVHAGFLQPLLLGGTHRGLSLTCEPLPAGKALRDVRRAKVGQASDAAQRARIGQVDDAAHHAEADDVARREADLVAGHGELAFTGLLVVSAPTREELDAACVETESAAAQAMCDLRRLHGQQAAAFTVAALPLARATS